MLPIAECTAAIEWGIDAALWLGIAGGLVVGVVLGVLFESLGTEPCDCDIPRS